MPDWRWNIYVLTVVQVVMRTAITSIRPFIPLYLPELGVTVPDQVAFWAGVVTSANFLGQALAQPAWGAMADRYGRKPMVVRSILAVGFFNLLVTWARDVYELAVLRFLMGSFAGFNAAAIALVAVQTPPRQLGYAVGLVQAGQMAGTILGPAVGGILAEWFGYRHTFLAAGCLSVAAAPVVVWAIREETPSRLTARAIAGRTPESKTPDQGCWDAVRPATKGRGVAGCLLAPSPRAGAQRPRGTGEATPARSQARRARRSRGRGMTTLPMLVILAVVICCQFGMQGADSLLALFLKDIYAGHRLNLVISLAYALGAVGNLAMAPVWGRQGDRRGHWPTLQLALAGTAVIVCLQGFTGSAAQFVILRALMGLFAAGVMPNAHALVGSLSERTRQGRAYGVVGSALAIGNFSGPLAGGVVAALLGVCWVFWVAGALLALVAVCVWAVCPKGNQSMEGAGQINDGVRVPHSCEPRAR